MNYVILLAGGVGKRMGADIPKQFCEELNISVLLLTILADGKARGELKVISALAERCMKERRPNSNYAIV